ncbi:MAG TPA: cupredoxin domain-containing protein [Stellaceae bacterium]|nr:cupredoxin domain-containing protein [Stellaceae bacterium]
MRGLALAALFCTAGALFQSAAAATWHVVIRDIAYHDVPKEVHVGDVVVWTNKDFIDHTATARDGSFDIVLSADKTARTTLKRAGKIAFYCRFHPQMTGVITVLP